MKHAIKTTKEIGDRVLASGRKTSCFCANDECVECQKNIGFVSDVKHETQTVKYIRSGRTFRKVRNVRLCMVNDTWHIDSALMFLPTLEEIQRRITEVDNVRDRMRNISGDDMLADLRVL